MKYDLQTPSRSPDQPNGDRHFLGLRMKTPREQLPEGYYARGENKRVGEGLETRPGTRTPLFANQYPIGTQLRGSGRYSNPNGEEIGLLMVELATSAYAVGFRNGTVPFQIPFNSPLKSNVEFTQHFDKIVAHVDDPSVPYFIWDGIDMDVGFKQVTGPGLIAPGFETMPNPPWSINFLDRAWFPIPDSPDEIGATDENDVTTWDGILHRFRVNTGTADKIIALHPFFDSSIIVGKRRSIDILKAIPQDLGDAFIAAITAVTPYAPSSPAPPRVGQISDEVGMVSRKAGLMAGGSFMFLSDFGGGGIFRITTDTHGQYIVDPIPVSEEIEPLIKRINWPYAYLSVGVGYGRYVKWFVPLDGCTYNNAALVLNIATGEWESVDFWNATARSNRRGRLNRVQDNPLRVDNIFNLDFYGASQLFAVDHQRAVVHMLYAGLDDQLALAETRHEGEPPEEMQTFPIQDVMETRGYSFVGEDGKTLAQGSNVDIALATLAPNLTFTQLIEGADGDEIEIGTDVPGRLEYKTAKPDYIVSNVNDDAEVLGRKDYSVQIDDGILLHDDGVRLRRIWPWQKNIILGSAARYTSFRVANVGGICQVRSVVFNSNVTRQTRAG